MPIRMKDADEIDDFFEEESCDYPEIIEGIEKGEFNIQNLPTFDFLMKIAGNIPSLFAFGDIKSLKMKYLGSRDFLNQIPRRGNVCLVRQFRVYDEKYFIKSLKEGENVGIYWSLFENQCDLPIEEEMLDDVYVVLSACFDVSCIDVVKTMLAHLSWGAYTENEVRIFPGCRGKIMEINVFNLDWEFVRSFDLKGMDVIS